MTNKGKTLLIFSAFAFVILLTLSVITSAQSQQAAMLRGPFMLAAGDKQTTWRIDQATGRVSYCMRDTNSMDPKFIATRPPFCSAWSE